MSKKSFNTSRRQLLKNSGLAIAGLTASQFFPRNVFAANTNVDHTLVYIFLRGGMDALSILPPVNDTLLPKYLQHRPKISFDAAVLQGPAGGNYAFGINSELKALKDLWDAGDISFIHGFGSLTNTTSHFDQMNYIEGGSHQRRVGEGFFQRAKRQGAWGEALALAAVEDRLPRSMMGREFVVQYGSTAQLSKLPTAAVAAGRTKIERLESNYKGMASVNEMTRNLANASRDLVTRLGTVNSQDLAQIPISEMKEVTRILSMQGPRPKIVTTSLNGWDFHSNLKSRILQESVSSGAKALATSLKEMVRVLKASGTWEKTTVVVMSEFGRRIVENGAQGTDHGRGGVAFLLGGKIQGRRMIYQSDYVSRLSSLYSNNRRTQAQLPVDFDYRLLMASIFERKFNFSQAQIFGQEDSVFADNLLGSAATMKLDTSDALMTAVASSYDPTKALATLRPLILG